MIKFSANKKLNAILNDIHYGSSVDKMSDSRLWETYKRQVGWVVRYIVAHSK